MKQISTFLPLKHSIHSVQRLLPHSIGGAYLTTKHCCMWISSNSTNDKDSVSLGQSQVEEEIPIEGAPGWKESKASQSEADVKADRMPDKSIEELKEETQRYFEAKYGEKVTTE